jgi:Glycosyl transferase family 2
LTANHLCTMLDIIILSKTSDQAHFDMVKRCVDSYLHDGDDVINSIIIVESNKKFDNGVWSCVSPKIKTITPQYKFNYNQFLNIALDHCTADVVCISNNDVVVKPNCIKIMHEFFDKLPTLMSASPVDRTWHNNSYEIFPEDNKAYLGYHTTKHLLGFCVFIRRSVFDLIGKFDERFHFYHQDNDLEMCLRKHNLPHAMITHCHIEHGQNKPESDEDPAETRNKLLGSQAVYLDKWNNPPYDTSFKKYKKLSVVSPITFDVVDELIEIVDGVEQATGQYIIVTDRVIDEDEQHQISEILNYKPTSLTINGLTITRKF